MYLLNSGKSFRTAFKEDNNWIKGDEVKINNIKGVEYIKTVNDSLPRDDLGNLPDLDYVFIP